MENPQSLTDAVVIAHKVPQEKNRISFSTVSIISGIWISTVFLRWKRITPGKNYLSIYRTMHRKFTGKAGYARSDMPAARYVAYATRYAFGSICPFGTRYNIFPIALGSRGQVPWWGFGGKAPDGVKGQSPLPGDQGDSVPLPHPRIFLTISDIILAKSGSFFALFSMVLEA